MYTFLILSSLSLVFYVALLVALYHDGRKRRVMSVPPVRKLLAGSDSEFGVLTAQTRGPIAARTRNTSNDVLWIPVAKHHWKAAPRAIEGGRAKLVCVAPPVDGADDRQCG
jgi:hypothetical protein